MGRGRHGGGKKSLGVAGLVALIFFDVAGTPAGCENAVVAAGPKYALIGFLVMPLVWSIPEALFTAELSSMFPEDAGFVQWVSAAFGEKYGYIEGGVSWVATALDAAIYPVLMKDYLISGGLWPELERSQTTQTVFMISSVLLMSALNYFGLKLVGGVAVALLVVCLLPFIVFIIVGIPQVKVSRWSQVLDDPADFDVGLYLNTLFWNLNYFDSASTLAGEVENPTRTFPRALAIAVVLVVTMYLAPLMVAIGVSANAQVTIDYGAIAANCTLVDVDLAFREHVCNQTKAVVAAAFGGKLKYLDATNNSYFEEDCGGACGTFAVRCDECPDGFAATVVSALGLEGAGPVVVELNGARYNATNVAGSDLSTSNWSDAMYAQLGEQVGGRWLNVWLVASIAVGCVGMYEADLSAGAFQLLGMAERGMLPKILAKRSAFGTPTYGIVLASCIAWLCVIFSLQELIEMLNISYVLAALLEIGAFLHLRWSRPDLHRPVRIPMSNLAVTVMMCPTAFFSIMVFRYAAWQSIVFTFLAAGFSALLALGMMRLRTTRPEWFFPVPDEGALGDDGGDTDHYDGGNNGDGGIRMQALQTTLRKASDSVYDDDDDDGDDDNLRGMSPSDVEAVGLLSGDDAEA